MTTNLLRRRVAPLATVPPPDRVAYVRREVAADTTTVPQRTGEI
jgi:hypothetical protein